MAKKEENYLFIFKKGINLHNVVNYLKVSGIEKVDYIDGTGVVVVGYENSSKVVTMLNKSEKYDYSDIKKMDANRYGNGGGVAVSSESGLAVGTNADLMMNQNNLQYRNGGRFEFRNTISRYNKMKELYQTNRESLEEINDYVDENYNGKKEEFIPLIYSVFPTTIKELGLTKEDFVFWLNDPNYYQGYFSEDNIGENDYARGGNMSSDRHGGSMGGWCYSIGGL